MSSRRPLLVGMNNPLSRRPEHALWPDPPGCTGWRLWRMLAAETGASEDDYLDTFDRTNLLSQLRWDRAAARAAAAGADVADRAVVLLGADVRRAFGQEERLLEPDVRLDGTTYYQVPHPSGRNRWYNEPGNTAQVGRLLAALYEEGRSG